MGKTGKLELENEHIAEEMVEHMVLEKIGALPDHGHGKGIRLKKKVKRIKKSYEFEFYLLFSVIILGEIWWLGNYFLEKFPKLESLFIF
jgi:hypothetical protein